MGMAFVDTLLTENADATVVLVDENHQPGGHWNAVYPFVRLHQPSAYYGVNSRPLGNEDSIDTTGWNEGFFELATGHEVCAVACSSSALPSASERNASPIAGSAACGTRAAGSERRRRARRCRGTRRGARAAHPAARPCRCRHKSRRRDRG